MKKLLLSISALSLAQISQAQLPAPNIAVEFSGAWENNNYVYKTKNNDFCDYTISVNLTNMVGFDGPSSPYVAIVRRGESKLMTLKWDGMTLNSPSYTYYEGRGNIYEKPDVGFVYALPVKQGDSVQVVPKSDRDYTLIFALSNASDTVYACREGIVCDNSLSDHTSKGNAKYDRSNIITIYHKDATMADYDIGKAFLVKQLVFPGDIVKMGDPIAVIKPVTMTKPGTDKTLHGKAISVGIYFLDKNKFANEQGGGGRQTGFVPVFHTAAGDVKLAPKTTYVGGITDQMATSDMSKREKERYLKDKAKK